MEILLRHGADVNAQTQRLKTPLHAVMRRRRQPRSTAIKKLHLMMSWGADVTKRDVRGRQTVDFLRSVVQRRVVKQVQIDQAEGKKSLRPFVV